jgi:demethylmenaquinone methyltransferase/2-methoxy-6-polyprenyl-1,4-benzoquinol methylase
MSATRHALDGSFGRQQVATDERRSLIRQVFATIAPRYDLMNDLMSLGIHRLWKRTLAKRCDGIHGVVIDLAGGTGDVARRLAGRGRRIAVCDPSLQMMKTGRRPSDKGIRWLAGEAESLPFADDSVDLLTIAFGIRNVTQISAALAEIHRVLAPGGRFVCLEFSHPQAWLAPLYDFLSWQIIPRLGATVAQAPIAYRYLVESIRRFPDQREFAGLIEAAGFADVRFENLSFGIACLHFGAKNSST